MGGQVAWSARTARTSYIAGAGEKSTNRAWVCTYATQGIFRCKQLEEHIRVFTRLLVVICGVAFDFNAQIRVPSQKLLQQRRQEVACHGNGTNDLNDPSWIGTATFQQFASVPQCVER